MTGAIRRDTRVWSVMGCRPTIGESGPAFDCGSEVGIESSDEQVDSCRDVPPTVAGRGVDPARCGFEFGEVVPLVVAENVVMFGRVPELAVLPEVEESDASVVGEHRCGAGHVDVALETPPRVARSPDLASRCFRLHQAARRCCRMSSDSFVDISVHGVLLQVVDRESVHLDLRSGAKTPSQVSGCTSASLLCSLIGYAETQRELWGFTEQGRLAVARSNSEEVRGQRGNG